MAQNGFSNAEILNWMIYFSQYDDLDLGTIKILDITRDNKNIIPAVQSSKEVLVLTDAGHPDIFYNMWNAGLGNCDILYNEGSDPSGPILISKLQDMIDRGINEPAAMLIINTNFRSTYQIGLDNQRFTNGSIRYESSEIRSIIMSKLQTELRDCILTVGAASIAVEAALVAAEGTVIAVEHRSNDRHTMEENASNFGLNNVHVLASVEDAARLPMPNTAFLVASDRTESEIAILVKRNPNIRIMIYTLNLTRLLDIQNIFRKNGIELTEMVQIGISRLNSKHIMEREPAPWLICGER